MDFWTVPLGIFATFLPIVILFLIIPSIEFVVIYLLIKNNIFKKSSLYFSTLLVNLISFLTVFIPYLLISRFIDHPAKIMILLIGAAFVEYFLFKWQFKKLFDKKLLKELPTKKDIIKITILANLISEIIFTCIIALLLIWTSGPFSP